MKFSTLSLAFFFAHGAMASDDGGLRAVATINDEAPAQNRRLADAVLYSSPSLFHDILNGITFEELEFWKNDGTPGPPGSCAYYQENFGKDGTDGLGANCVTDNTPGDAPNVKGLSWSTTSAFDTRVEITIPANDECLFKDKVTGPSTSGDAATPGTMTTWHYKDMEAFGGYFRLKPGGLDSLLEFTVYIDGERLSGTAQMTKAWQFWGVISEKPFQSISITGATPLDIKPAERYNADRLQIFPWCSPMSGGIKGDPHVKAWNGNYYDFHGECDLVYLHDEKHGVALHTRTTLRYDYSYVEAAALRIGDDIFEVGSFGEHSFNGVDSAFAEGTNGHTIGGYPIHYTKKNKKTHTFDVILTPHQNITIMAYKDIVSVSAGGDLDVLDYFSESTGLMGSAANGKMLGRDGTEYDINKESDMNAFGQEWQVRSDEPMLFRTVRAPQYPNKCEMPSTGTKEQRRLSESSVSMDAAERACANFAGATFEKCVYDVVAFGDLELAEAGIY